MSLKLYADKVLSTISDENERNKLNLQLNTSDYKSSFCPFSSSKFA